MMVLMWLVQERDRRYNDSEEPPYKRNMYDIDRRNFWWAQRRWWSDDLIMMWMLMMMMTTVIT